LLEFLCVAWLRFAHKALLLDSLSNFSSPTPQKRVKVTFTAANPKLDMKVSLHPAFQCMVI
jgi:hypothetical protein